MRLNPSIDDDVRARGVVLPNLGEDRRVERPVNRGILLRGATERLEAHPALLRHRPELRACGNEDVRPGVGPPLGDGRLAAAGWSSDHEDHPGPSDGLVRLRPERDAHRLEAPPEADVSYGAGDDLPEGHSEEGVQEPPS